MGCFCSFCKNFGIVRNTHAYYVSSLLVKLEIHMHKNRWLLLVLLEINIYLNGLSLLVKKNTCK